MANTLRELGSANGFDPIGTTPLLFIGGYAHGRITSVADGQETVDVAVPTGVERVENGAFRGAVLLETPRVTYHRRTIEIQAGATKYKRDMMVLAGVSPQQAETLLAQLLIFAWVAEPPPEPALGWPVG